jgi:hypothetical protein
MNCSSCGKSFRLCEVSLADANSPGIFFRIAIVFWILAGVAAFFNGILLAALGLVAVITTSAMITSTWDNNGGYGKPKCPHCKAENTVRFWHL